MEIYTFTIITYLLLIHTMPLIVIISLYPLILLIPLYLLIHKYVLYTEVLFRLLLFYTNSN